MANNNSIKVTYELLYEYLRKEQDRGELQKIEPGFWSDVEAYIAEKNAQVLATMHKTDIFSLQERDKVMNQIRNAKRIIQDLFDKRESKIIQTALNKSRTNAASIQDTNLMEEEKQVYHSILGVLSEYRNEALSRVLSGGTATIPRPEPKPQPQIKPQEPIVAREPAKIPPQQAHISVTPGVTVKFVQTVPKFVGKELEVYGPFEKEQVTALPQDIANILINNGSAVQV